ncbi:MAG: hypothetical protein FJW14_07820 [Acidimicrobiia bacterium]|nr:hypothetical protein [Acidimicrobiia bacterium]
MFGWQWCAQKGYGAYEPRWSRAPWGDIIFRIPRRNPVGIVLDRGPLRDILGQVTYGRLDAVRDRKGVRAPLEGRWIQPETGSPARVLQIRASGDAIAELTDLDGDGIVDVALVNDDR